MYQYEVMTVDYGLMYFHSVARYCILDGILALFREQDGNIARRPFASFAPGRWEYIVPLRDDNLIMRKG